MSSRFFDVLPNYWYYNDVVELEDIILDNDKQFISGFPFNNFVVGKEAVDIIVNVTQSGVEIVLDIVIRDTTDNRATVYVDGFITSAKITPDSPVAGKTKVSLTRPISQGQTVRIIQQGVPMVDSGTGRPSANGQKPFSYPHFDVITDSNLMYASDITQTFWSERALYNGAELRRVEYSDSIHTNKTFFSNDYEYTVSPDGILYAPFNLNNEVIEIKYSYIDISTGVIGTDGYTKLRATLGIDESLVYFGFFPNAKITRSEFFAILNNLRLYLTRKYSVGEPYRSTKTTSRFSDVQSQLSTNPWWWVHIRDLEELKLPKQINGKDDYLINGRPDGTLDYNALVNRAEIITLIDKFRQWFIEAFK